MLRSWKGLSEGDVLQTPSGSEVTFVCVRANGRAIIEDRVSLYETDAPELYRLKPKTQKVFVMAIRKPSGRVGCFSIPRPYAVGEKMMDGDIVIGVHEYEEEVS